MIPPVEEYGYFWNCTMMHAHDKSKVNFASPENFFHVQVNDHLRTCPTGKLCHKPMLIHRHDFSCATSRHEAL